MQKSAVGGKSIIMNEENRLFKILKIIECSNLTSSKSIADKLGVSTKTVKNEIKELNRLLKGYGVIDVKQGKNVLYIIDQVNFDIIFKKLEKQDHFLNSQQNRMSYIFYKLMNSKLPYLTDDLAYEMKISKTTILNDLKKLRIEMESYNLKIVGKRNMGLFLEGNEIDIRMFFLQNMFNFFYKKFKIYEEVIKFIFDFCEKNEIEKNEIKNFIKFFTLMLDRLKNEHTIKFLDEAYLNLKPTKTFKFVDKLLNEIEKIINIKIPLNERLFMVIPLISMRTPINYNSIKENEVSDETIELVNKILSFIKNEMNITIVPGEFLEEFIYHMFFMINRVKFGIRIKNQILEDVKEKYLVAFKMAEISMGIIEDKLEKKVSKDEVGYIAMYFGVFMAESSYTNKINKVMIICADGMLTARMMSIQLKKILPDVLCIDIYSNNEINDELLGEYDLICSTHKFNFNVNIPIIYVKEIFDENQFRREIEQIKYSKKLERPLLQGIDSILLNLLDEDKFFVLDNKVSYQNNIDFMIDELYKKDYVDKEFKDRIKKRENNSSMVFDNHIAIPHVVNYANDNILLALGVYENNLILDKDRSVKLVFLLGVPENIQEKEILLIKIYNEIISISTDKNKINEISKLKHYKDLVLYKIKEYSRFK